MRSLRFFVGRGGEIFRDGHGYLLVRVYLVEGQRLALAVALPRGGFIWPCQNQQQLVCYIQPYL